MPTVRKGAARKAAPIDPGILHGFRSGLEEKICQELRALGVDYEYETHRLPYTKPVKVQHYMPDIILPNGIVVELKGRWVTADRQKHIAVKAAHPDVDIRFIFSRSKSPISKGSKTTYADYCRKHGWLYADAVIPREWINEPVNEKSRAALCSLRK